MIETPSALLAGTFGRMELLDLELFARRRSPGKIFQLTELDDVYLSGMGK